MEDYFNGAWYFHGNKGDSSHYGVTDNLRDELGRCGAYRLQFIDSVPWQSEIRATVELGHANMDATDIAQTVYYYADSVRPLTHPLPERGMRMPFKQKGFWYSGLLGPSDFEPMSKESVEIKKTTDYGPEWFQGLVYRMKPDKESARFEFSVPVQAPMRVDLFAGFSLLPDGGNVRLGDAGWAEASEVQSTRHQEIAHSGMVYLGTVGALQSPLSFSLEVSGGPVELNCLRLEPSSSGLLQSVQIAGPFEKDALPDLQLLSDLKSNGLKEITFRKLEKWKNKAKALQVLSKFNEGCGYYVTPQKLSFKGKEETPLYISIKYQNNMYPLVFISGSQIQHQSVQKDSSFNYAKKAFFEASVKEDSQLILAVPICAHGYLQIEVIDPTNSVSLLQ